MSRPSFQTTVGELASAATREGQKFLVLRNYELLPHANVGSDIDLLILPDKVTSWKSILARASQRLGLKLQSACQYYYCRQEVLCGVDNGYLRIDLLPHLSWRGIRWASVPEVIDRAIPWSQDIWIPHPADECLITFCHSYLYGGFVREAYLSSLAAAATRHHEEVRAHLRTIFGKIPTDHILEALDNKEITRLREKATRYRLVALLRGLLRSPIRFAAEAAQDCWMEKHITETQHRLATMAKQHGGRSRFHVA